MSFPPLLILAQAIGPGSSFLEWTLGALGSVSSIIMLLSAVCVFAGACYLVATKRRPAVLAAYLILLPLPVIFSLCGWIQGSISALVVIAGTPNLELTNADVAGGLAIGLMNVFTALIVSAPTYVVLAYGLLIRTLRPPTDFETGVTRPAISPAAPRTPLLGTTGAVRVGS